MYTYIVGAGADLTIHTPGITDMSQIKNTITQSPEKVVRRSVYPNGLILDIKQTAAVTIIRSNRELTKNRL